MYSISLTLCRRQKKRLLPCERLSASGSTTCCFSQILTRCVASRNMTRGWHQFIFRWATGSNIRKTAPPSTPTLKVAGANIRRWDSSLCTRIFILNWLVARYFGQIVFFGLQYFLKRYLAGVVVTEAKINEAEMIYKAHFGPSSSFPRDKVTKLSVSLHVARRIHPLMSSVDVHREEPWWQTTRLHQSCPRRNGRSFCAFQILKWPNDPTLIFGSNHTCLRRLWPTRTCSWRSKTRTRSASGSPTTWRPCLFRSITSLDLIMMSPLQPPLHTYARASVHEQIQNTASVQLHSTGMVPNDSGDQLSRPEEGDSGLSARHGWVCEWPTNAL